MSTPLPVERPSRWLAPGPLLAASGLAGAGVALIGTPAVIILVVVVVFVAGLRIKPYWLISLGLCATVFSGYSKELNLRIGADRALIGVGLIALLVGLPIGWRSSVRLRPKPIQVLMATMAGYATLSAVASSELTSQTGSFALLDRLGIIPFLLFCLSPLIFFSERSRKFLLGALVVTGLYLGITALLEGLNLRYLTWPSYINNPALGEHFDRARGPFLEAVGNGLALFECAIAALVGLTVWRTGGKRFACCITIGLCLLGTVFTLTRSVWIATPAAIATVMVFTPRLRRWLLPVAAAGGIAVSLLLIYVPGLSQSAGSRANNQLSVWDRYNLNAAAVNVMKTHPVFGIGWNKFETKGADYFVQADLRPLSAVGLRVHNVFLNTGAELGLLGLGLWVAVLAVGIGGAIMRHAPPQLEAWRLGLLAIFVNWLIVANFTPGSYAFATYIMWVWAGIVASPYLSMAKEDEPALRLRRQRRSRVRRVPA